MRKPYSKWAGGIPDLAQPPLKWCHGWVITSHKKTQRLVWLIHATTSGKVSFIPVKLPWIFPGAPLTFNEAPGNVQGNLTGMKSVEEAHSLRPPLLSCFKQWHCRPSILTVVKPSWRCKKIQYSGITWYGMVWYWYWYGMVWYGMVW